MSVIAPPAPLTGRALDGAVVQSRLRAGEVRLPHAVGAVILLALALRGPALTESLPTTQPDEHTVVSRAQLILDGEYDAPAFDWPLGTSWVLALAMQGGEALGLVDRDGSEAEVYGFARWVFLSFAVLVAAVTALLAAAMARRRPMIAALVAGGLVSVDFVMVRIARMIQPDHLQVLFVVLALVAVVRAERAKTVRRQVALWLAAGLAAGFAGGMKYLGVTVVVVPVMAILTRRGFSWYRRLELAVIVGFQAFVGFVVATGGSVLSNDFVAGFMSQWSHQSQGHLGYDHGGPTWLHHLVVTIPGSIGWGPTVGIVLAVAWALWRGDKALRLVAGYAVLLYGLIGLSRIEFPHYVIIVFPILAAVGGAATSHVVTRLRRHAAVVRRRPWLLPPRVSRQALAAAPAALLAVVALALVPSALNDVRLLRSDLALDTRPGLPRELTDVLADRGLQDAPVWTESYTGLRGLHAGATGGGLVFGFGDTPEIVDCDCVVLLSSYQEQRYADDPERGHVYKELRDRGRVVLEREPGVPLTYRWDLLPPWGVGNLPLTGEVPPVGPAITVLDLTNR